MRKKTASQPQRAQKKAMDRSRPIVISMNWCQGRETLRNLTGFTGILTKVQN